MVFIWKLFTSSLIFYYFQTCLGTIQGAKYLSEVVLLSKGYVSPWILELARERDAKAAETTFHVVPQIMHMIQV